MQAVRYIFETMICSGIFLALYRLVLAGKVRHRVCRAYIVGTMLLSAVIPALNVPLYTPSQAEDTGLSPQEERPLFRDDTGSAYTEFPEENAEEGLTISLSSAGSPDTHTMMKVIRKGCIYLYLMVAAVSLGLLIHSTARIYRLRKGAKLSRHDGCDIVERDDISSPFSFIRTIYIGPGYTSVEREMIITHETSHIRHGHSYERIILSVLRSLLWPNPFLWRAANDLKEVQEWEADYDVLEKGNDLTLYRKAIFKQLFGYNPEISSGLNHSLTKKRFIMMTRTKLGSHTMVRLAAVLPLIAAAFLAFGCGTRSTAAELQESRPSETHSPATGSATAQDSVIRVDIIKDGGKYWVAVNGKRFTPEELGTGSVLEQMRASGIENKTVEMRIDPDVPMGIVTDTKYAMRGNKTLRLNIFTGENDIPATVLLPPLPPKDIETIRVNPKDIHILMVNAQDAIMFDGFYVKMEDKEEAEVIETMAADIIRKEGIASEDKEIKYFFSLNYHRDSSPEIYVDVNKALRSAYSIVRDEYARQHYGKPLSGLTPQEQEQVKNAVPLRISEAEPASPSL